MKQILPLVLVLVGCINLQARQQIEVTIPGIEESEILIATGIGTEILSETVVQPDGSLLQVPTAVDPGQLTIQRLFKGSPDFIDWMNQAADPAARDTGIVHRDIACRQRIGAGTGLHVLYLDAFPVAYEGPDFAPDSVATESLTFVYDAVLTLLAPDPFEITGTAIAGGELIIKWKGELGAGHIEYANSLTATADQWNPVTPSELVQDEGNGQARIPLESFSGNHFFFRITKP